MGGDGKANKFNNKNVKKRSRRHRGYVLEKKIKSLRHRGMGFNQNTPKGSPTKKTHAASGYGLNRNACNKKASAVSGHTKTIFPIKTLPIICINKNHIRSQAQERHLGFSLRSSRPPVCLGGYALGIRYTWPPPFVGNRGFGCDCHCRFVCSLTFL